MLKQNDTRCARAYSHAMLLAHFSPAAADAADAARAVREPRRGAIAHARLGRRNAASKFTKWPAAVGLFLSRERRHQAFRFLAFHTPSTPGQALPFYGSPAKATARPRRHTDVARCQRASRHKCGSCRFGSFIADVGTCFFASIAPFHITAARESDICH